MKPNPITFKPKMHELAACLAHLPPGDYTGPEIMDYLLEVGFTPLQYGFGADIAMKVSHPDAQTLLDIDMKAHEEGGIYGEPVRTGWRIPDNILEYEI